MTAPRSIVVLAAGSGSRFVGGAHKLAEPLGDASVLAATLRNAISSRLHVVVVTTAPFADIARSSVAARDVVVVPAPGDDGAGDAGMGFSIAAGVRAAASSAGWLVLPADMPLVRPATLQAVAGGLDHHPVAYAQHLGRRGHPVGFAAELFSELILLKGDEGARRLLLRYPAFAVDVDDAGILVDIDTEADLASVRREVDAGDAPALSAAAR